MNRPSGRSYGYLLIDTDLFKKDDLTDFFTASLCCVDNLKNLLYI